MYEIWLAMNIAFEIVLDLWPALLPLALLWAWRRLCCCGPCWPCAGPESASRSGGFGPVHAKALGQVAFGFFEHEVAKRLGRRREHFGLGVHHVP